MKHLTFLCFLAGLTLCIQFSHGQNTNDNADIQIKISSVTPSKYRDTLFVDFKFINKDGKKVTRRGLENGVASDFVRVTEDGKNSVLKVLGLQDTSKMSTRMRDKTIYLLMDRSAAIPGEVIESQYKVVKSIIEEFENSNIYLSFMENGSVSDKKKITSSIGTFKNEFLADECKGEQILFTSVMTLLNEILSMDSTGEKYLFVFTDGEIYDNKKNEYYGGDAEFTKCYMDYANLKDEMEEGRLENIPVFCFYMNPGNKMMEANLREQLEFLATTKGKDDREGRFYEVFDIGSLSNLIMRTLDSIASDYQLILGNQIGRKYDGTRIILGLEINHPDVENAYGEYGYAFCSPQNPCEVQPPDSGNNLFKTIFIGLLIGLLMLGISYLVMQLVIPAIGYAQFRKKYQKKYEEGKNVTNCYICKRPIASGQLVTTQCSHKMHWKCWEDMNGLCPQCSQGDHYYNKEKPFQPRNAFASMKWILFGMAAGLMSWICFRLFCTSDTFSGLIGLMTSEVHTDKFRHNLLGGIILGFYIVFGLGYALEYRKKTIQIIGTIALRALVGSLMGFVAFLIGDIVLVLAGQSDKCWWLDWLPWVFFSVAVAAVLSIKTEVKFTRALLGGIIAIMFSYILLYNITTQITAMISYMVYAAGLGGAIYAVHTVSEKYFLRFVYGSMDKKIAIHKWMNVSGGQNKVSIGHDTECTIRMNWDNSEGIANKAVELFLDEKIPYLMVLADNVTRQGRIIKKGTKLVLNNGDDFCIGKTVFTYIENNENTK